MDMSTTETTIVVNVKVANLRKRNPKCDNLLDWLDNDACLYIGRDMSYYVDGAYKSKWHNPYKVAKPGKIYKTGTYYSLDESLILYEEHVKNSSLVNDLEELRGKELGCWCKPNRCHGDILVKLLELNK
jgi:hypothetical protein